MARSSPVPYREETESVLTSTGRVSIFHTLRGKFQEGHVYRVTQVLDDSIVFEEMREFHVEISSQEDQVVNGFEVSLKNRTVKNTDGNIIELSVTEWRLLEFFVTNRGRTLSGQAILRNVWGDAYKDDKQYLRVWVAKLRKKFNTQEGNGGTWAKGRTKRDKQSVFRNVIGSGYILLKEEDIKP